MGVHERSGANRGMWVGKAVSARRCAAFVVPFSFGYFFFWASKRKVTRIVVYGMISQYLGHLRNLRDELYRRRKDTKKYKIH